LARHGDGPGCSRDTGNGGVGGGLSQQTQAAAANMSIRQVTSAPTVSTYTGFTVLASLSQPNFGSMKEPPFTALATKSHRLVCFASQPVLMSRALLNEQEPKSDEQASACRVFAYGMVAGAMRPRGKLEGQ
jgi:hypothetical protein